MEFLMVTMFIALYSSVGGVVFQSIQNYSRPRCKYRGTKNCDADCGHSWLAVIGIFVWPVLGPILLGKQLVTPKDGVVGTKAERRRAQEIAEMDHKIALAEKSAQETRILERAAGL